MTRYIWASRLIPGLVPLALSLLLLSGCSSDPAGVGKDDDSCQEAGILTVCGADTTRVDTLGTGS